MTIRGYVILPIHAQPNLQNLLNAIGRIWGREIDDGSKGSAVFPALWRGPGIRRVGYRSERRSNGLSPNYLPARSDVRVRAGQVRDDPAHGAARGQVSAGPGVRCSDEPLRDSADQMPAGPGVRRSDEPLRNGAGRGQMPARPGSRRSDKPLRNGAGRGQKTK